jgi:adiponectin receptor
MWRASMYVGFALSSAGFMLHGLLVHGWEVQNARMSFVWVGWMAVANLVGAAIYVARVNTHLSNQAVTRSLSLTKPDS